MRIVQINDIANVGFTITQGLRRLGHEAELKRLRLAAAKSPVSIKLLALPLRFKEALEINSYVTRKAFDIVHIHFAYLGWLGIFGKYPYVLHCHGTDVREGLNDHIRRPIILFAIRNAAIVLYSTPDLTSIFRRYRQDAIWLPNPINTDRFTPDIRKAISKAPLRILIISRLNSVKKVGIAFETAKKIHKAYPHVIVSAIDDGSERGLYNRQEDIEFVKPVRYEDMPTLINSHDIILGQFGIGSLGMSELEGMACAKPVIVFVNKDLYKDSPPVLTASNSQEAFENISHLIDDRIFYNEVALKSREWVVKHHNYMHIVSLLTGMYHRLLNLS